MTWDDETDDGSRTRKFIKGTKMVFAGIKKDKEAAPAPCTQGVGVAALPKNVVPLLQLGGAAGAARRRRYSQTSVRGKVRRQRAVAWRSRETRASLLFRGTALGLPSQAQTSQERTTRERAKTTREDHDPGPRLACV